ncbi:transcription factor 19-like [Dendronephthya gigantea]|uniref:transcription factor 19-like n=1 Tax=Dendronephthya gigantea TaxID=151771 RepID=UPI001069FB21|nr:transcription factor 19-like [Dendronephthya gigantea]
MEGRKIYYRLRRIGDRATMKHVADVFVLQQNITVIGRAKRNVDFFIASSKHKALISRIHARISKSQTQFGDVFKIYDVSLNGTFVNDIKIPSEALLKPGDVITFGHVQGALLQTGNCYKQLNSEFRFLFESFHCEEGIDWKNYEIHNNQKETNISQDILDTPATSSFLSTNGTIDIRRVLSFDNSDDYNVLKEDASMAASCFTNENETDEDFFPPKYSEEFPSRHAACENKYKSLIKPEKKRPRSTEDLQPNNDACSASKCMKPDSNIISWVQCDDCDCWYHIKCCGLSLKLVQVKNSKFHCGCL